MTTVSKLAVQVIDDLSLSNPGMFSSESQKTIYVNALQGAITEVIQNEIPLSRTEPDYERVILQLYQSLSEDPQWYDMLTAGAGTAIVRMIASGITYDQFSIQRALQEAYMGTATSDNAVFAGTRMLGVRPRRKLPARVSVDLSRDPVGDYYEIPQYSVFGVNQIQFFNRDKIVFKSLEETVTITLFQGLVVEELVTSDGEPFQTYVIGNGTRTASDVDVIVTVDGEEWTRITEGPWLLGNRQKVFYESTTATGDIEIRFGNGDYGAIPGYGVPIKIQWVETLGLSGNLDSVNDPVVLQNPENSQIYGETKTPCQGGDNELSADIYRRIAPNLRAANRRAVRRSDYNSLALEFAGVRDALFRGQAELAPGRRSMMNVIGVTILTDGVFSPQQWEDFRANFNEHYGIYQTEFLRIDPTPVTVNIDATIYCRPDASLANVKAELTSIVEYFFQPKKGHLGYSVYLSDISDILNGRNPLSPNEKLERSIEYAVIRAPSTDVVLDKKTKYCRLGTLNLVMDYTTRGGYQGRLDMSATTQPI